MTKQTPRLCCLGPDTTFCLRVAQALRTLVREDVGSNLELVTSSTCVLWIQPDRNLVRVSEFLSQSSPERAWVVIDGVDVDERNILYESGAKRVLSPEEWTIQGISERVGGDWMALFPPPQPSSLRAASQKLLALIEETEVFAAMPDPVLILGETGTGKEHFARLLHEKSHRKGPFLVVNCAGLQRELVRSELFGHTKGAFTGADRAQKGILEAARGGTVFLDEVGELTDNIQAMLLRAIQFGEIQPVGATTTTQVEVRLVMATHQELELKIEQGDFRQDLHERIRAFTLKLPSLRERKCELRLLAEHFLEEFGKETGRHPLLTDAVCDLLYSYNWPGNVRELRGVVRFAAAFVREVHGALPVARVALKTQMDRRRQKDRASSLHDFNIETDTWKEVQKRTKIAYFRALYEDTGGDVNELIRRSGLSKSMIYKLKQELDLEKSG